MLPSKTLLHEGKTYEFCNLELIKLIADDLWSMPSCMIHKRENHGL